MFEICYIHSVKDFDNIQEASGDLLRRSYVDHLERNFTDLFNFNNIAADEDSSDSVKNVTVKVMNVRNEEVPLKKSG